MMRMGDALLQKTYTTESFPFVRKKNRGECAKYYIENSNAAIISKETFNAAKELQRRLRTKSILSESEFSKQTLEINSKISKLRSKRKLLLNDDSSEESISNLKHLSEIIDNFDYRDGFNEEIFSDTVEQIKAGYDNKLVFTLSGGLELTEIIK